MRKEYVTLIRELDKTLSLVGALWRAAALPEDRTKWCARIDELLDERLRLMKCRDALALTTA